MTKEEHKEHYMKAINDAIDAAYQANKTVVYEDSASIAYVKTDSKFLKPVSLGGRTFTITIPNDTFSEIKP